MAAVLFDLDGTLIDSAPDLATAANAMRTARGLDVLPLPALRPHVGSGARGMVGRAFGLGPGDADYEALRAEFLERYAQVLLQQTQVFASVLPLLAALRRNALPWGIVTNKALALAQPIVHGLAPLHGAACLIGGDSTAHRKPHPAPLLAAAQALALEPKRCVYVGDDPRDIEAGRAAGMRTVAAAWGYLGESVPIEHWRADSIATDGGELLQLLELA